MTIAREPHRQQREAIAGHEVFRLRLAAFINVISRHKIEPRELGLCRLDYWRWHNSVVGDCLRTAPVAGHDRVALPGVTGCSAPIGSGHIMTPREHWCGEFKRVEGGAA